MNRKIILFFVIAAAAGVLLIFRGKNSRFFIVDEFGLNRSRFPYVEWRAEKNTMEASVAEIIDYRTFRTANGEIILLCALDKAINGAGAVLFMKKEVLNKAVVISVFGVREDYSGVSYGVVFYDNASKCLNRELHSRSFADVKIEGKVFNTEQWFGN
ncbi:MAG: hypothetical protein ABIJ15_04345 [bacterium]